MGKRVLVITGGDPGGFASELRPDAPYDLVIAADSGLDRASALGLRADIVVGDLDSASAEGVVAARRYGAEIDAHPAEKDHTDLELALELAVKEEASEIAVIGGGGGRPDHWLANLGLIAGAALRGVSVSAHMGRWSLYAVVPGQPYAEDHLRGELMSLLPIGGDARGVTTAGLAYPLAKEDLAWNSARGVSNLARGGPVRVELEEGAILLMRANAPAAQPQAPGARR